VIASNGSESADLVFERNLVLSEPQCNVQKLHLLNGSEDSLHPCRKQATGPPATWINPAP